MVGNEPVVAPGKDGGGGVAALPSASIGEFGESRASASIAALGQQYLGFAGDTLTLAAAMSVSWIRLLWPERRYPAFRTPYFGWRVFICVSISNDISGCVSDATTFLTV